MSGAETDPWLVADPAWRPDHLTEIRTDPRKHAAALAVAILVGLAVAWVHWLGLFVAGALVGLVSPSVPRAVGWGFLVGGLAIVLTVVTSPMGPAAFVAFRPPAYVTLAAGLLAPIWGSLARLVV